VIDPDPLPTPEAEASPYSSPDAVDIIIDGPFDTTRRPLRRSLLQAALAELERQQNPTGPPGPLPPPPAGYSPPEDPPANPTSP
jgi:hypothetical protein